ncbi:MAG: hypothetical protein ACRD3M_17185 [Thermoanaerobaculia bacterium]
MSHDSSVSANRFLRAALRPRHGLAVFALLIAAPCGFAATFYLSPGGSDSNTGTSTDSPWKTWKRVFRTAEQGGPVLRPGDKLLLLDGEYTRSETGLLYANCGGPTPNANSGTAGARITIQSLQERGAHLIGDGSADTFRLKSCRYYDVIGIYAESADNPHNFTTGQPFRFDGTPTAPGGHIAVRRCLARRNNRYANAHVFSFLGTAGASHDHNVFEENECYDFFLKCVLFWHSRHNIARRNYGNSRFYGDLPGSCPQGPQPPKPKCSGNPTRGGELISCYPCGESLFENNISEGQGAGFTIDPAYTPGYGRKNRYYGNVSLNEIIGFKSNSRSDSSGFMPRNTEIRDFVVLGHTSVGVWSRTSYETRVDHTSVFPNGERAQGYVADNFGGRTQHAGDGVYSVFIANSFSKPIGKGLFGTNIQSQAEWSLRYVWASGHRTNFSPPLGHANIIHSATTDPGVGPCRLWIPDGAAARGAASDGGDLGATILYRYEDGALTDEPLWDPKSGAFLGAGARVAGVNDAAGASLFDVNTRLNVNWNGCRFPAGYPATPASRQGPRASRGGP